VLLTNSEAMFDYKYGWIWT